MFQRDLNEINEEYLNLGETPNSGEIGNVVQENVENVVQEASCSASTVNNQPLEVMSMYDLFHEAQNSTNNRRILTDQTVHLSDNSAPLYEQYKKEQRYAVSLSSTSSHAEQPSSYDFATNCTSATDQQKELLNFQSVDIENVNLYTIQYRK